MQVSVLHYAINIDAPSAPRSPAKGRLSFARVGGFCFFFSFFPLMAEPKFFLPV
jgi:hypothetical protein